MAAPVNLKFLLVMKLLDYPKALSVDILLAMSPEACVKYSGMLKKKGKLLVDTTLVKAIPDVDAEVILLPITAVAQEEVGHVMYANIVALGALVGNTGVVGRESLIKAVLARVPHGTEEKNQKALELGFAMS